MTLHNEISQENANKLHGQLCALLQQYNDTMAKKVVERLARDYKVLPHDGVILDGKMTQIAENSLVLIIEPDNISSLTDINLCEHKMNKLIEAHGGQQKHYTIYRM